ncbi:MAG: tRNA pseudouridine(13) synthase TruD [Candidatus Micrarchaeota archaeon]
MPLNLKPEEFTVEEITANGTILEKDKPVNFGLPPHQALERDYFTHFALQKRLWNTRDALAAIARKLGVKPSRFDSAGTKDRNAVTTQLCSAFAIPPERILGVQLPDVAVLGAWKATEKVKLGALGGNKFSMALTAENCSVTPDAQAINRKAAENNFQFPNYYGSQRFGSLRENTHLAGKLLVENNAEGAVMNYLSFTSPKEREESTAARQKLATEKNFTAALGYFPRHLKPERAMLEKLARNPGDWAGALRTLPRQMQLMLVHAHQSQLFNKTLKAREEAGLLFSRETYPACCGENALGFPDEEHPAEAGEFLLASVFGSESKPSQWEERFIEREGLQLSAFNLKSFPELSSKGTLRAACAPLKGFSCEEADGGVTLRFALPPGSYATVAAEWLLETLKPVC